MTNERLKQIEEFVTRRAAHRQRLAEELGYPTNGGGEAEQYLNEVLAEFKQLRQHI